MMWPAFMTGVTLSRPLKTVISSSVRVLNGGGFLISRYPQAGPASPAVWVVDAPYLVGHCLLLHAKSSTGSAYCHKTYQQARMCWNIFCLLKGKCSSSTFFPPRVLNSFHLLLHTHPYLFRLCFVLLGGCSMFLGPLASSWVQPIGRRLGMGLNLSPPTPSPWAPLRVTGSVRWPSLSPLCLWVLVIISSSHPFRPRGGKGPSCY